MPEEPGQASEEARPLGAPVAYGSCAVLGVVALGWMHFDRFVWSFPLEMTWGHWDGQPPLVGRPPLALEFWHAMDEVVLSIWGTGGWLTLLVALFFVQCNLERTRARLLNVLVAVVQLCLFVAFEVALSQLISPEARML
jgi:hypothetical protein